MLTAIPKEITLLTVLDGSTSSAAGNYLDCNDQAAVVQAMCGEQESLTTTPEQQIIHNK